MTSIASAVTMAIDDTEAMTAPNRVIQLVHNLGRNEISLR